MELLLFRTLVVVAEHGSFTDAAERLCVTQSAVSRRIRQLEEHYGVPLLERGAEVVRPTDAGLAVLQKARQMLAIEEELEETLTGQKQQQRIGFCCTPCFGTGRLPDIFERYVANYGLNFDLNITFQMPEDVLGGLVAGRYDLAVVEHCDDLDLGSCPAFPLPSDEMVFVSSPGMGITNAVVTVDRLASMRLILKTYNGCAYRFLRRSLTLTNHDISDFPNVTYYDDLAGVVRQVVGGHGIGFVSRELASREIESGQLVVHNIEGFLHYRPRTLLISPRYRPGVVARRFVGTFFESFGVDAPAELCPAAPGLSPVGRG